MSALATSKFVSAIHTPNSRVLTVGRGVRLDTVDHVGVSSEHVDHLSSPLVPDKHPATVTAAQHPVLSKEICLLDLKSTNTHTYGGNNVKLTTLDSCYVYPPTHLGGEESCTINY